MALTTAERITVDGVDLKTFCWNIETLGATLRTAPRRGANAIVAGRSGSIHRRFKPLDEARYVWPMWVLGCDSDGNIPGGSTARREFFKRVDELTRLLMKEHGLLDVRHTLPDGTVRQAFLEVQALIDYATAGVGQPKGLLSVELVNPASVWQEVTLQSITDNATPYVLDFGSGATASLEDAIITLTGPITNPIITDTFAGDAFLSYAKTIAAGTTVTFNAGTGQITQTGGHVIDATLLTMQNTNGRLARFIADPVAGGYRCTVTGSGTTGATSVQIQYRRKYATG